MNHRVKLVYVIAIWVFMCIVGFALEIARYLSCMKIFHSFWYCS